MKTNFANSFHGEPGKNTRRRGLTEQISANATILSHLIFKIHQAHNLSLDFEEEKAILESMEASDGIVV